MIDGSDAEAGARPPTPRVVEVDIPSDVRYIERVVELVQRECEVNGFGNRAIHLNVPVALSEALSNAILRGNGDDPSKNVHVRAAVDAGCLVVEVHDEGRGFDLEAIHVDPTAPENLEREDGRGIFLMRSLMDSVEQLPSAAGTMLRLTLRRE